MIRMMRNQGVWEKREYVSGGRKEDAGREKRKEEDGKRKWELEGRGGHKEMWKQGSRQRREKRSGSG